MLRGHQRDAGVHQRLLGVQHVERGALADAGLLANAVERHFRGSNLGLRGCNLSLGRLELAPRLHHGLAGLVADQIEVEPLLSEALLGLTDQREFAAALVDRNGKLADDGGGELVDDLELGKARLLHAALQAQIGKQRAFVDLDLQMRDVDPVHGGGHIGVLGEAGIDRGGQHPRRKAIDRRARSEIDRLGAHYLPVVCPRRVQNGLCRGHGGLAGRKLRLRLGHVGSSHLADVEAVASLLERLLQDPHVGPLDLQIRRIAQHVHIGGRSGEQHGLLHDPKPLARRRYLAFRCPGPVRRLKAVEQRLGRRRAGSPRRGRAVGVCIDVGTRLLVE